MEDRFVARHDRGSLILYLLVAIVGIVLGLLMIGAQSPRPGQEVAGWVVVALCGLAAGVIADQIFDEPVWIVIDRDGILARQWSDAVIPWRAIRDIRIRSFRWQRFVCLYLHDPSLCRSGWLRRLLRGLNRAMGYGDASISASGTDRSFAELEAAIDRYAKAAGLAQK